MNIALRKPIGVEASLDWEERQELRYEFDGFRPIAMTGGTSEHSAIQRNLIMALGIRLRGKTCQVHGSGLKIAVAAASTTQMPLWCVHPFRGVRRSSPIRSWYSRC